MNRQKTTMAVIISIHALRGEGDVKDATAAYADYISIHALRGEGDITST